MKTKSYNQNIKQLKRLSSISANIVKAFAYYNGKYNKSNYDSVNDLLLAYQAINREYERILSKI